jgi:exonuclease III
MSTTPKELRVLQYNVNHGKEATLIPLLRDTGVKEFDILAIQEPWRNPFTTTGYNPSKSEFYLAYPPRELTRTCFYINKRLHPDTWTVTHHNEDAQTLTIRIEGLQSTPPRTIQIHNIYNPSPGSYTSTSEGTLGTLRKALEAAEPETEHIIIGDFNLHHPYWSSIERLTQHAAADILLEVTNVYDLELATPPGTTTWQARGTQSTIDLAFLSHSLVNELIKCITRLDLAQSSDHIPIELTLRIRPQLLVTGRRRCWKKTDLEKMTKALEDKVPNTPLYTNEQIDTRIYDITRELHKAIDASVPWARPSNYAKDYWSDECEAAVHEARKAFYDILRGRTEQSEENYKKARNRKVAILRKYTRDAFRSQLAETTSTSQGTWKLMKWARDRAKQPHSLPQLPPLVVKDRNGVQIATTLPAKIDLLKTKFFPQPQEADLTDIPGSQYPDAVGDAQEISRTEISDALQRVAKDKAPGPDQIPNRILKAAAEWLVPRLHTIFNAGLRNGYHPHAWKQAITLALRKPGKDDYTTPKAYRPIALLNTMGKLLELVMGRRLSELAETNGLLPDTQMGARKGRSAETALQLITEQVYTIWNTPGPKKVATLLSLDISGAFDYVSHDRLLHNLRKRKIPEEIVKWVRSFLTDRTTTIKLFEGESEQLRVETGIPQGSPVSPILFLFFIADLLEITNNEALQVSSAGFVDDVNILTYGTSTERNCEILEEIHRKCAQWAVTHGARFAPEKYEVLHLTRNPKKFNLGVAPSFEGIRIETKPHVRILGVQVDTKLRWGPHLAKIREKEASLLYAMGRITSSTWGASFEKAKLVYSTVVKPALLYGAGIWYGPQGTTLARKTVDRQLETTQNHFLRKVSGAYRAVGSRVLEKETNTPPISIALNKMAASGIRRQAITAGGHTVQQACARIRNNAQLGSSTGMMRSTPLNMKRIWLEEKIPRHLWGEPQPQSETQQPDRRGNDKTRTRTWKQTLQEDLEKGWEERWTAYLQTIPAGRLKSPAQVVTNSNRPDIHKGLSKATSALITQIRTEKIGLNGFLSDRKVPGYLPTCPCGWQRQTAKHIIMDCTLYQWKRDELFARAGTKNYQQMLVTTRGCRLAAQFLQGTGLLAQFSAEGNMK